ncbi:MAG: hypothetical protein WAN35_06500 [Terracidiphilus sp.]
MVELGCSLPESGVTLLPLNFDSAASIMELRHASETSTIRKLLLQEHIPLCDVVERGQRPPYIKNKSADLVLPTLYLSAHFLSQNSPLVSIALNVISSYIYDRFRVSKPGQTVKFDVVFEDSKSGKYRRIAYEGTEEGLKMLPETIREAIK